MNEENNKENQVDFYKLNNLNLKPKIKDKKVFIIITVITALVSFYGRLNNTGLITAIFFIPIFAPHFVLFIVSGIMLSNIKEKDIIDYILLFILCLTMILYAYTFVDSLDNGYVKAIDFIDRDILYNISSVCFKINAVTAIISIIRGIIRNKKK